MSSGQDILQDPEAQRTIHRIGAVASNCSELYPLLWKGVQEAKVSDDVYSVDLVEALFQDPSSVDRFGLEVQRALQAICNCPKHLTDRDPLGQVYVIWHGKTLLDSILAVDSFFMKHKSGPLFVLFRKTIATAQNLSELFRICDWNQHETNVSDVPCQAAELLATLCTEKFIWSVKMSGGTPFALALIPALAAFLDREAPPQQDADKEEDWSCRTVAAWTNLYPALGICLRKNLDEVVLVLSQIDWKSLFDRPADESGDFCDLREAISNKLACFALIRLLAVRVLQINKKDTHAMELLLHLGSCEGLCRRVLRRIVSGQFWTMPRAKRLKVYPHLVDFLHSYLQCLAPLPDGDREFDTLTSVARAVLIQRKSSIFERQLDDEIDEDIFSRSIQSTDNVVALLEDNSLEGLKHSAEYRQELFEKRWLEPEFDRKADKIFVRQLKKNPLTLFDVDNKSAEIGSDGEMCANCHALQPGLLTCARCNQMKYCCRECQLEHWKKVHKKLCKEI